MKKIRNCFIFSYLIPIFFHLFFPVCFSQLSPSEIRILFRLQQILEFPPVLHGWTKTTNFCYYPSSPYLTISCSGNHVTELTIVGTKSFSFSSSSSSSGPEKTQKSFTTSAQTLSEKFSSDSFFTTVTKLSSLKVLSLVALGIWGPFPEKINRLRSLQVLNLSSNFMYGTIPPSISSLKNLRSLVLEDNLLNGTVPDLSGLVVLEELNLGSNLLGPKFPSVGSKTISLVLRNNTFHSEIPDDIKKFEQLQRFDISFNEFVGAIPADLFSLPSIKQLNLAGNEFRGAFQVNSKCSDTLEFVDLSHNLLNGNIPACLSSNSSSRTVVYSWNCLVDGNSKYQHPNSFCNEKALAVKPPIQFQKKEKSKSKLGLILGATGAVVAGVGVSVFLVLGVIPKLRAQKAENKAHGMVITSKKATGDAIGHVSPVMRLGFLGLPSYHIFSSEEIGEASNNFDQSNLMEDGSHDQLYKGWLGDGSAVVIRCFKHKQTHSSQTLTRSMEMISKLRHQNLVSILGHCIITDQDETYETGTVFLVFEYISNNTLRSHLTDWRKRDMLKWPHRMTVITNIAKGIQFLHTGISPGMFGNNLNIENILLDNNLTAKINSYHLPLPAKVGSEGTLNITETPNHLNGSMQGEKEDIYHLGIILLEVITGKIITSQSELDPLRIQMQQSLTDLPSKLKGLADTSIQGTFAYESLKTTVEIAINCLSKKSSERPSIEDVLWNLQYSAQVQDGWTPSCENLTSRQSYSSI